MDDRDEPWHGRLTKQDSLGSPGDGCRTQGMFDTLAGAGKENVTKMTVDRLALNVAMITESWWVGIRTLKNCCHAVCYYRMDSAPGNVPQAMMMIADSNHIDDIVFQCW